MEKLTKRVVDALKPRKVGVKVFELFVWDRELRGFGVRVSTLGLKSFFVQYRTRAGRHRRTVIGRYGLMTVEQARAAARERLVAVASGLDPAAGPAANPATVTVKQVCDWYLAEAEAGRILGRRRRPIKASTLAMDRSRIATHVELLLGGRPVRLLALRDIEGMQADIAGGRTARPRVGSRGGITTGGNGVAARTVSTLHSIFEHAVRLGMIEANPARGVRRLASEPRDRRLRSVEIESFGAALRQATVEGEHPTGLAAIRFLLLTGFRRMEGLALRHDWLCADEGCVRFPDTKSGTQVRVIGRPAVDLVVAQVRHDGSAFVFPADWGEGHFVGLVRVLERVCARAGLEGVTPHVLRHTFASVAGDLGFSELTIAALLGHAARGVTQRYVHIDEALRIAADRVAGHLAGAIAGASTPRATSKSLRRPAKAVGGT